MASSCICPGCGNRTVMRLQAKLDKNQVLMLGYFCARCILKRCYSHHKKHVKKAA